jgi:hypothetical protein
VREFWRKLPPSYRFNPGSHRYEEMYEDWDCYGDDFEGIRAQDILPLLIGHFHFELFIAFANIVDPFVGRAFGSNFDPAASWDRSFVDQLNERDEREIASGRIKPTHMLAVLGKDPGVPTLFHEPLSPQFCLRDPSSAAAAVAVATAEEGSAYEWGTWPHSDRRELEIACGRLKELHELAIEQLTAIDERSQWALGLDRDVKSAARRIEELDRELEERNQWARHLDQEVKSAAGRIEELDRELAERNQWARRLDGELTLAAARIEELDRDLAQRAQWAQRLDAEVKRAAGRIEELDKELVERTQWAWRLDRERVELGRELEERTLAHRGDMERLAWALALDRWFHVPLDGGFRLVRRAVRGVKRMLPGGRQ